MHRISWVKIQNYRSCISAEFPLSDFTPLVGYNNGGKSNLLAAIVWFIKPKSLSEDDFNDSEDPVEVEAVIEGVSEDVLGLLDPAHRKKIEPLCTGSCIRLKRTQTKPNASVKSITLHIWNQAKADKPAEAWDVTPTGIPEAIQALFPEPIQVGAMEDSAEDVTKSKTSSTIGGLLAEIIKPIEKAHGEALRNTLAQLQSKLDAEGSERPAELVEFDREATEAVEDLFPGISVRLHIPTPEVDVLLKSGTIIAYEGADGRDVTSLGHGAQRAIQMALIRYLAEMKADGGGGGARRLLVIEEPELYLHPQAIEQVRIALKRLSMGAYQVLLATHSPLTIGHEDVANTLLIRKTPQAGTHARRTIKQAVEGAFQDAPSQARMIFSLTNSSQVLFSDRVLLAEGKTEELLLPRLFEAVRNRTLPLERTALVCTGSVDDIPKCLRIFAALDLPSKAVVDLDFAFRGAVRAEYIAADDEDLIACKAVLARLSPLQGFALDDAGLPKKGGPVPPSEAFALMACDVEAAPRVGRLHDKLLGRQVWLWQKGSIENHLGIEGKNENAWADFSSELATKGYEAVVADADGIKAMFEWVCE